MKLWPVRTDGMQHGLALSINMLLNQVGNGNREGMYPYKLHWYEVEVLYYMGCIQATVLEWK